MDEDFRRAFAVLDSMFYAMHSIEGMRREVEMSHIFAETRAKLEEEGERTPAKPINHRVAITFMEALADYGFQIVPLGE